MSRRWWAGLALAVVVTAGVTLWQLGRVPLAKWDEGIHANVAREVIANGAWLDLSYHDRWYNDKPPVKFWLTAPLIAAFGPGEFGLRIWSAIGGLVTVTVLYVWVFQRTRSIRLAVLTGLIFTTGRFIFFHSFRTGETDGLMVALWTLCLYAYWRTWDDPRWWRWVGVTIGLLLITKQVSGFVPAGIIVVDLTLARAWRTLPWRMVGQGVGIGLLIAAPWHILMSVWHGAAFWKAYVGYHVIERSTDVLFANNVPWHWYWHVIRLRWFPYAPFILFAIVMALPSLRRSGRSMTRLSLIWAIAVFVLFSVVKTKFDWYMIPIYPALTLLLTLLVWRSMRLRVWVLAGWAASLAYLIAIMPSYIVHQGLLWRLTPYPYLWAGGGGSTVSRFLFAGALVAALWFVWWRTKQLRQHVRLIVPMIVVYILGLASIWTLATLRHLPTSSVQTKIAEAVIATKTQRVESVGLDLLPQPNLYYYLRRIPKMVVVEHVEVPSRTGLVITRDIPGNEALIAAWPVIFRAGDFVLLDPRQ